MEHLDEILERLLNKPKDKQTTIFDIINEKNKQNEQHRQNTSKS